MTHRQRLQPNPYLDSSGEIEVTLKSQACCSTKCCQEDLDRRQEDVEDVEGFWSPEGGPLGPPWQPRKLFQSFKDSPTPRVIVGDAKKSLWRGTGRHFLGCLRDHCRGEFISNRHRLESGESLYHTRAPRIPDRPDILEERRILQFRKQIAKWEECDYILEDRQSFNQNIQAQSIRQIASSLTAAMADDSQVPLLFSAGRVLSETRLEEIDKSFAEMLQTGDYASQIGERFGDLSRLQIHVDNVEPLGKDPEEIALEFVIEKRRLHLCRLQMKEYLNDKITRLIYNNWWVVINYIRIILGRWIRALNVWLKDQPEEIFEEVKHYYLNGAYYVKDRTFFMNWQNHHPRKQPQSGHSSSSGVSSSVSPATICGLQISVEPESMQSRRQNDRFEEAPNGKRDRRNESSGSDWGTDRRPPLKKNGRSGEGKAKETSA